MLTVSIAIFGASHRFAEPTSQMQWFHYRFQKPIVDQTSSRPAEGDHDIFGDVNLAVGSALELLSVTTELVIARCHIKYTFCHTSQSI